MSSSTYEEFFTVEADHPSLPGHFPGDPILPGVVVLDRVLDIAERWLGPGIQVIGLPRAKFALALRPGNEALVRMEYRPPMLEFEVSFRLELAVSGAFEVRVPVEPNR